MKQKEYDQWNDPKEFYSDDYFLSKKGVAILHDYVVECYLQNFELFLIYHMTSRLGVK